MGAAPNSPKLPSLAHVLRRDRLFARKAWGQNFLTDMNLARRIARAGSPAGSPTGSPAGQHVLEIGAGPGGLTRALLLEGAQSVLAVERDTRCRPALQEIAAHWPQRVHCVFGDALDLIRADALPLPASYRIAANLPFQLSSPLLLAWLSAPVWPPRWQQATLLVQKEFAERLASSAGRSYGRLSVLAQWRTAVRLCFAVSARAFVPPPKVDAAVLQLRPRARPHDANLDWLQRTTAAAFGQRRKMLRTSLKALHDEPARLLAEIGISAQARAEHLSVAQFCALSNALQAAASESEPSQNKIKQQDRLG